MKQLFTTAFLLTIIVSCSSTKQVTTNISFIKLNSYAVNASTPLPDALNYKYIMQDSIFHQTFYMTKTTPATAIVPDFNTQSVIAIVHESTEKVIELNITKAEIAGNNMNVYYTLIDTTSWTKFSNIPKTIVAVPKSADVKHINFYGNNEKMKSLDVE